MSFLDKATNAATNAFGYNNLNLKQQSILGALSPLSTPIGAGFSGLIGLGLSSGAGNAITGVTGTLGNALSSVNPILGGIVSIGGQVIGGLTNAAFGSKMNQAKINEVESSNQMLANTLVDSSSNENILSQWGSLDWGNAFSKSDIGKDGWFSNKAENKYNELALAQLAARSQALGAYANAINTADTNMDLMALANVAANGGKIYIKPENRGKFTALKERTGHSSTWFKEHGTPAQKKMATFALNAKKWNHAFGGDLDYVSLDAIRDYRPLIVYPEVNPISPNSIIDYSIETSPIVKDKEGKLHTKDAYGNDITISNKEAKERRAEGLLRLNELHIIDSLKKSNKKAFGGDLLTHGANFDLDYTYIGNGNTHENNPYEGVLMGIDDLGVPNLVEEGEVVWNDYVFSNRLKNPNTKNTFAKDAKKALRESDERPNDWISLNGKDALLSELMLGQEEVRNKMNNKNNKTNYAAHGGKLYLYGGNENNKNLPSLGQALRYTTLFPALYGLTHLPEAYKLTVPTLSKVSYTPTGTYMKKTPVNMQLPLNLLAALAAGTRNAIMNLTNPSRFAGLLAADLAALNAIGDTTSKLEKQRIENDALALAVNNAIDYNNAKMAMETAIANQNVDARQAQMNIAAQQYNNEQLDNVYDTKIGYLNDLFGNLGNMGTDLMNLASAKEIAKILPGGEHSNVLGYANPAKCGGKIKRRKKGLTY